MANVFGSHTVDADDIHLLFYRSSYSMALSLMWIETIANAVAIENVFMICAIGRVWFIWIELIILHWH